MPEWAVGSVRWAIDEDRGRAASRTPLRNARRTKRAASRRMLPRQCTRSILRKRPVTPPSSTGGNVQKACFVKLRSPSEATKCIRRFAVVRSPRIGGKWLPEAVSRAARFPDFRSRARRDGTPLRLRHRNCPSTTPRWVHALCHEPNHATPCLGPAADTRPPAHSGSASEPRGLPRVSCARNGR